MIFGFSLYTGSLPAALVVYFGIKLGDLANGKPLESDEIYYYQH